MNQLNDEPMADVRDMYMVHTMLRREFGLLPQLIRDVAPDDIKRSEVVGAHAEFVCEVLHLHHEGEDVVLWPLLHQRGGEEAEDVVPVMERQHHGIESANAEVLRLLPQWRSTARAGQELAEAFDRLQAALLEHMAMEEERILPLAEKYVTAAEWRRLGEHSLEKSAKKSLPLAFGMAMYEGDREVVAGVLAEAPLPVRLLMPAIARRWFARHATRVHGTPTPPRATH
ncbi:MULTISPECIES: hemerythrin domain-containing protein [Streptomycetaceae]|uniref:hemerythrin domain-containing protein n=1 Tax=Streptomycetaceae TaxID=2062 RepID=UPI00036D5557|nr:MULTISPECIES: hemerythrin domain-containing protein [Streptomycetaceae]MYX31941.1 hemerythrin domain-containing protein [Streptomyces sp. SID8377]